MKEKSYSLKFHIFDAIKNDGCPTYGTFHEDRLYVGYVDGPAIMISVTADYYATVYSDSLMNTINRYDCYEVGRTNIVIGVPNTNIAKGYITDFSDCHPIGNQRRRRIDIVQGTIQQFLLYIIYPISKYYNAWAFDTVHEIHEIMKSYYYNYYELLKPIGIMFENGDEEHVKKNIHNMFVPEAHDFEYMF